MSTTVIPNASGGGGGGSLPTDPSFNTVTATGAISAGGQVSSVATIGLLTSHVTTDNTNKTGIVAARHYTNANRPVGLVTAVNDSSQNTVYIGGGTADVNAATLVAITTATNNNTATGTTRTRWQPSGERQDGGISTTPAGTASRSTWWTDLSGNPFCRVGTGKIIDIGALGLTATAVQTANYTAAAGELVLVDPSAASADITITLPATAAPCAVMVVANAAGRHNVLIGRNGNTINGLTDVSRFSMQFAGQAVYFRSGSSGYVGQVANSPVPLNAYMFTNAGTYQVSHNASLSPGSAISFDFWIYASKVIESNQYIWMDLNGSDVGMSLTFAASSYLLMRDGSSWRTGPYIYPGFWHHITVAYGSSNTSFYVNGVLTQSVSSSSSIAGYTGNKFFGGKSSATERLDQVGIWNFRIWGSKLTASDALAVSGAGVPVAGNPLGSSPVLWFRGQEARTSAADISGNSFNGTLSGTVGTIAAPRS